MADKVIRICEFCRSFDFLIGGVQFSETDIVGDRPRKEVRILKNHCHRVTQIVFFDFCYIDVVVSYLALVYIVEAVDKVCNRGLSCAG